MSDTVNIAIIGGGAAGLATAIFAAEAGARDVVVFDGAKKIGAKILVSGGGRCNVTHNRVSADDFNGPSHVVRNVLAGFNEQQTVAWFDTLGVALKREDTGKLFPVTDDANTVLDALLRRCGQLGVEVRTHHRVADIRARTAEGGCATAFEIVHSHGTTRAGKVVMATGGRSLPKTGSDGAGWFMVKRLGHTVTPTYPALVPLVLDDGFFHASISGVSHEAELSTFVNNKRVDQRTGSLLWTHFGISGPIAMDASRFWVMAHTEGKSAELRCSFAPGRSFEQIDAWLCNRDPKQAIGTALAGNLPRRLVEALCGHVSLDPAQRAAQLPRDKRRALAHAITGLPLPVVRDRGWNYAEVTAGGVPMSEVDFRTMASRKVDGLHLVGEILDVDGRIGGFNFQWAWSTAHAAGTAMGAAN
ncbi:NAD(P)/FAD-dependent oxidoreductase [Planctomycetales bacterium ZRK34]|nr:NAD(P)/FAD-dependent oxidoreductase [Planctomycetales bacterium ZRK34]